MTRTLNGRLVRRVVDGVHEKLCRCCDKWMPLDDHNFQFIKTTGAWSCYCRTCIYAKNEIRAKAKKAGLSREEYLQRAHEFAPRGERLPHTKLNTDLVREIRQTKQQMTSKQWAEQLGVHIRTITGVREYRTWRHVA